MISQLKQLQLGFNDLSRVNSDQESFSQQIFSSFMDRQS